MQNAPAIRPIHYASVSGGKDSLFMMKIILENPQKYPLDMVVHFELEIDWPFVKNSVNAIKNMCDSLNIPFKSIKPRMTWQTQYEKWGFPTRQGRWCNSSYKLDAKRQLEKWIKAQKCRPVAYIGFCADETKRFKYNVGEWNPEENQDVCYPLAEEGIIEDSIREWAKSQENIFGNWYKIFRRQGCWCCPNISMLELAYLLKHYPQLYANYSQYVLDLEYKKLFQGKQTTYFHKPWPQIHDTILKKWLPKLEKLENP